MLPGPGGLTTHSGKNDTKHTLHDDHIMNSELKWWTMLWGKGGAREERVILPLHARPRHSLKVGIKKGGFSYIIKHSHTAEVLMFCSPHQPFSPGPGARLIG